MTYSILFDNQPRKFLRNVDKRTAARIINKLQELSTNPIPHQAIQIASTKNVYRLRLGSLRVLYRINPDKKNIIIVVIDKRERVYHRHPTTTSSVRS